MPVVIHRAIFGSFERFIALLIEHSAGAFPLWLSPVQVIVLPIADRHASYAGSVREPLAAAGLRVELDERQEKIGYKIREAQLQKVPYMLVVGDREAADGTVAVRSRSGGRPGRRAASRRSSSGAREEIVAARPASSSVDTEQLTARSQKPAASGLTRQRRSLSHSIEVRGATIARASTNGSGSARSASSTMPGSSSGSWPRNRRWRSREQKGLDLVEVSPTASPPVCRIMDFGRYQYLEQKRARQAKKHQKVIEIKEIKFRPKVDEHDYQFKKKHIERFIADGDKVKATVFFRGREIAHPEIGRRILQRLVEELADVARRRNDAADGGQHDAHHPRAARRRTKKPGPARLRGGPSRSASARRREQERTDGCRK